MTCKCATKESMQSDDMKLVQIQLVQVLFMNMFMNLFKFNLFKFCSNFVLKFEHVHEQFMNSVSCLWTCSPKKKNREKNEGFSYVQVVPAFPTPYSFSVTFFLPFGLRPFFILLKINDRGRGRRRHRCGRLWTSWSWCSQGLSMSHPRITSSECN
jgi:hypothetical protein